MFRGYFWGDTGPGDPDELRAFDIGISYILLCLRAEWLFNLKRDAPAGYKSQEYAEIHRGDQVYIYR